MSAGVRLPWMINIKLTFDICDDAWYNVVMVKEENTIHQKYLDLVYIINVRMWISEINELNKMYIYECGPGARCVEMSWPWWAPALLRSTSHFSASHSTSRMGNMQGWTFGIAVYQVYIPLLEWRRKCSFQFIRHPCIRLLQPFKHTSILIHSFCSHLNTSSILIHSMHYAWCSECNICMK